MKTPQLARCRDILSKFEKSLPLVGLVGEARAAKLLYLALVSRLLDRIVSVVMKGPSTGGKSFVVKTVLQFFPEDAYSCRTSMSAKALLYSKESFVHRTLVIYEVAGIQGDFASYAIRSLLSEGQIDYEVTVPDGSGSFTTQRVLKEGPTGLITTTTDIELYRDNENRVISLPVNDTAEQTVAIMMAYAVGSEGVDFGPWHELQEWLAEQPVKVAIPFAPAVAALIPPASIRLRRDFPLVLSLVISHSLLHQATRERDAEGRVVATLDDYEVVRELVGDLVSEAAQTSVPQTVRETVTAVRECLGREIELQSLSPLCERLGLDKSTVSRRVRQAVDLGHLVDSRPEWERSGGHPLHLRVGTPLPEDRMVLPTRQAVETYLAESCRVALDPERGGVGPGEEL